jgi:hypothetical protein
MLRDQGRSNHASIRNPPGEFARGNELFGLVFACQFLFVLGSGVGLELLQFS